MDIASAEDIIKNLARPARLDEKRKKEETARKAKEEEEMLLLIVALIFGVLLLSRSPRLERSSGGYVEPAKRTVRAYVDGKPVKSYLKE